MELSYCKSHLKMDSEDEIKIEYNETFERDPLAFSDKVLKTTSTLTLNYDVDTPAQNACDPEDSVNETSKDNSEANMKAPTGDCRTWYKTIDKNNKVICMYCNQKYSTVQTLRYHVKKKHMIEANEITSVATNKRNSKLRCHICKSRFKLISELTTHVIENHDIENLQSSCHLCNAYFNDEKSLIDHYFYKHKGESMKRHICKICAYRTSKKSHYDQHQNTHDLNKRNQCKECDYSTNYLPNLRVHERIHNKDKPYKCVFEGCNYICSAKSALHSHELKHNSKDNTLLCDQCSYKTVYSQSLKKHLDSHARNSIKVKLGTFRTFDNGTELTLNNK